MTQIAAKQIRTGPIFSVMIAGAFVAFLNQTLMNTALPQVMDYFHVSATTGDWITTIYMLVNGVLIPITAFLMERFTTRQLYITAMALFALGTLICATAPNFGTILIGRVIQASGAGIIMPLLTNVIFVLFPAGRRGAAMGIMGVALNFAPTIGPTLSGWIVETQSWRMLFYIVLPIAMIDLVVSFFLLRNVSETKRPKLDVMGVILSTVGFGGLLYAFSEAGAQGWGRTDVVAAFIVGGLSLVLFVWRQLTVSRPILEFRIFRYPMFTLTTIINALVTMALFAGMILMPLYMQNVRGFSPLLSGVMLLPGGILTGIMSPITGKLFDKIGARALSVCGLAITVVTTYCLATLTLQTTFRYVTILYTIRMFGMAILMMPIMTAGLNELPLSLNRYGTAMLNTIRMISGSVGMALLVTVMSTQAAAHVKAIAVQQHILPSNKTQMTHAILQASVMGINDAFLVATALAIVAFLLAFFIRKTSPKPDIISDRTKAKASQKLAAE